MPMKSYLFTAVYNRCMNEWRDRKKTDTETDVEADHLYPVEVFRDTMERAEMEEHIYNAIAALAPRSRKIFEMNRFEGKTYREISEALHISQKTVETLMSRSLKMLREKLKDYLILLIGVLVYFLVT
jgi:RNA polymerase sigma-70 factor, ECF subfamily